MPRKGCTMPYHTVWMEDEKYVLLEESHRACTLLRMVCADMSMDMPYLYLSESYDINAFVVLLEDYSSVVVVTQGALQLSAHALMGLFAHELGHIALKHHDLRRYVVEMELDDLVTYAYFRRQENQADAFAAKHGFARQLASALSIIKRAKDATPLYLYGMDTHPMLADRINKLTKS